LDLAKIIHGFADLINTAVAALSNILARIVDLACNLVQIMDCDFILELLADSNLDKAIVGSRILLQIWAGRFQPPPPLLTYQFPNEVFYSDLVRLNVTFYLTTLVSLCRGVNTHLIYLYSIFAKAV
jgi:hypothetical protein